MVLVEHIKAIEPKLLCGEDVLGELTTLDLEWPSGRVPEVNTDGDWVLLHEQVAVVDTWVCLPCGIHRVRGEMCLGEMV